MPDESKELQKEQQELQESLSEQIETDIRQEWLKNTLIWVGVVAGSFVVCLLLLVAVTGG